MRILYHTTYDKGVGADRWIVDGYRAAFTELGHTFFTTESERHPLADTLLRSHPDLFIISLHELAAALEGVFDLIEERRLSGMRLMVFVDDTFRSSIGTVRVVRERRLEPVYFGYYAPELMKGFESETGEMYHLIPLAAHHRLHVPGTRRREYDADIAFIGNRLPTKESMFRKLLLPLMRRYRVRIYGPGWTMRDKIFRLVSGLGRKAKLLPLADWANEKRVSVPPEAERDVYASAKICLNIHEYYPDGRSKNYSNEREFKIPACGGFELTDSVLGIERFFTPDKEIVVARDEADWFRKIDFYLMHDAERRAIQVRGTARARREHTYFNRARLLLELAGFSPGKRGQAPSRAT